MFECQAGPLLVLPALALEDKNSTLVRKTSISLDFGRPLGFFHGRGLRRHPSAHPRPLGGTCSCRFSSFRVSSAQWETLGCRQGEVVSITMAWQDSPGHLAMAGSQS